MMKLGSDIPYREVIRVIDPLKSPFSITNGEAVDFIDLKRGDLFLLKDYPPVGAPAGEDGSILNLALLDAESQGEGEPPTVRCVEVAFRDGMDRFLLHLDLAKFPEDVAALREKLLETHEPPPPSE